MTHTEIEELLGAFALDAVEQDEADEIVRHLDDCPRCRAEVVAHREVAGKLGNTGTEAPSGLWDKIAETIAHDTPALGEHPGPAFLREKRADGRAAAPGTVVPIFTKTRNRRRAVLAGVVTVAAAAVVVLAVSVGTLRTQVQNLQRALGRTGLSAAVAQAAIGPHRTIQLTSDAHLPDATVIVGPTGSAYWVSSSLRSLPAGRTYQIWGLNSGRIVSLGLVGPDPHHYAGFRLEASVRTLMVTAEPEGGAPAPTGPVLAKGSVPAG